MLFLSVEPEVGLGCRQETNTFYFMTQLIFDIFIQVPACLPAVDLCY